MGQGTHICIQMILLITFEELIVTKGHELLVLMQMHLTICLVQANKHAVKKTARVNETGKAKWVAGNFRCRAIISLRFQSVASMRAYSSEV